MKSVTMIADVLDPRSSADRWYVTNGATAVGPVNLELLARGIEAGRVPLESFVRHEAWKVWRPLSDIAVVESTADPGPVSVGTPRSAASTDDITSPGRPSTVHDQLPADAIAGASDVHDALLLLMAAAVQATNADGAIIHRVDDEGAIAVCAHGPQMFQVLGEGTRLLDPVMVAAAAGSLVVAEPTPGAAGHALLARMACLGVSAESAVMVPIRPRGRLLATLELGRRAPLRAKEIAAAEALVDALVEKIEADGWVQ